MFNFLRLNIIIQEGISYKVIESFKSRVGWQVQEVLGII
jgi:hypothetical protein